MNPTQIAALATFLQQPTVLAFTTHPGHTVAQCLQAGHDQQIADRLNLRDQSGFIPRRWVVQILSKNSMQDARMKWTLQFGTFLPPNQATAMTAAFFAFCCAIDRTVNGEDAGLLMVADLTAAKTNANITGASPLFPSAFLDALIAGERKMSRAETNNFVDIDGIVTAVDVGAAR